MSINWSFTKKRNDNEMDENKKEMSEENRKMTSKQWNNAGRNKNKRKLWPFITRRLEQCISDVYYVYALCGDGI